MPESMDSQTLTNSFGKVQPSASRGRDSARLTLFGSLTRTVQIHPHVCTFCGSRNSEANLEGALKKTSSTRSLTCTRRYVVDRCSRPCEERWSG